jgi:hypothetical protein
VDADICFLDALGFRLAQTQVELQNHEILQSTTEVSKHYNKSIIVTKPNIFSDSGSESTYISDFTALFHLARDGG